VARKGRSLTCFLQRQLWKMRSLARCIGQSERSEKGLAQGAELKANIEWASLPSWRGTVFVIEIVLLSLLLPVVAHSLSLYPPGFINLEFLFIGLCGVFLPRSVVVVLLVLDTIADFASAICQTYFLSLRNLLASLPSLISLPLHRMLEFSAVLSLFVVACVIIARSKVGPEDRFWTACGLLFLAGVAGGASILLGQNPLKHKDAVRTNLILARSPLISLVRNDHARYSMYLASLRSDNSRMDSASSRAMAFLKSADPAKAPDLVLIVVESWGLPLDAQLARALNAPYDDPSVELRYDVSHGSVPFDGSTVPGEARELCNSRIGFNILRASPEILQGCLPALLHARDYQDVAIHGYLGSMFGRESWYSGIGFDQRWFGPALKKQKLSECDGPFPGTCDAAIAGWIGNSVLSTDTKRPRFIYWVTLNSHLPVPLQPDLAEDGVCSTLPSLRNSAPLCSWFRLVRNVHQSVHQLSLTRSARPTVFVVVGDHAPPFADPELRQLFSATDVPYVLLTPKPAL